MYGICTACIATCGTHIQGHTPGTFTTPRPAGMALCIPRRRQLRGPLYCATGCWRADFRALPLRPRRKKALRPWSAEETAPPPSCLLTCSDPTLSVPAFVTSHDHGGHAPTQLPPSPLSLRPGLAADLTVCRWQPVATPSVRRDSRECATGRRSAEPEPSLKEAARQSRAAQHSVVECTWARLARSLRPQPAKDDRNNMRSIMEQISNDNTSSCNSQVPP